MDSATIAIIVSLVIAIGGIITSRATATGAITDAAMKLIKPLNERIDQLCIEVEELKRENTKLTRGVKILIAQLKKMKVTPDWTLEDPNYKGNRV